jgi:hypothetical protein
MSQLEKSRSIALALALLAVPATAAAERSAERASHVLLSERHGFSERVVQLQRKLPGPGRELVVNRFMSKLANTGVEALHVDGAQAVRATDGVSVVSGRGWKLRVAGNGERVGYVNFDYLEQRARQARIPVAQAPRIAALEPRAREFIRSELADSIKLGKNERLIAWKTLHRIDSEGDASGAHQTEGVAATVIDFKREIDGLPVLGPGSTVSITFATDGSIAGFDYDWASFEQAGKTVRTAAAPKLLKRLETLTRRRQALKPSTTAAALAGQAQPRARVKRTDRDFVCGYHDAGSESAVSDAIVQPACVHQYVEQDTETGITAGIVSVVPLADTISPVGGWAETSLLRPAD